MCDKKTIYNVYIPMESQEQCNRMKKLCIDNNLPIWDVDYSFELLHKNEVFGFDSKLFWVMDKIIGDNLKTQITEQEFIELLKEHKNEQ